VSVIGRVTNRNARQDTAPPRTLLPHAMLALLFCFDDTPGLIQNVFIFLVEFVKSWPISEKFRYEKKTNFPRKCFQIPTVLCFPLSWHSWEINNIPLKNMPILKWRIRNW